MFEQTIALIGKPLNDPALQTFMAENGFKQPKRTEISGQSSERNYWVEHKKLGINLLFDIDIKNPLYPPIAGSKKNLWVPVFHYVTFLTDKFSYPYDLKIGLTHDETVKLLGAPSYKSSDITLSWLNDDGSEAFFGWHKPMDDAVNKAKQIELHARIWKDEKLDEITINVIEYSPIFSLFDALHSENLTHFEADINDFNQTSIFMEWAIKDELYIGQASEQEGIAAVKNGLNMLDFFRQTIKTPSIYLEFFAPAQQQFVRQYIKNMSSRDVYYRGDYSLSFLTNNTERNNPYGETALNTLEKLDMNDANKARMFAVLDMRFAEFNAHGFAKSTVKLKN